MNHDQQEVTQNKNHNIQFQLKRQIAQTLLLLQDYKLKTNFIGCNMTKKQFQFYYHFYRDTIKTRLNNVLIKFNQIINQLYQYLIFAQFAQLKALNNIIRDYRRRVSHLTYQPTKYSYAKFQKQEKYLHQVLLKLHFTQQTQNQINKIKTKIQQQQQNAQKSYQAKQSIYDQKYKTSFQKILKVIDDSKAQCSRLYDNFQRSMNTIQYQVSCNFDKFTSYVTKWQHVASVRAYEVKSKHQQEIQAKMNQKNDKLPRNQEQAIQQLTQAMNKCLPFSPARDQYMRKIQDLRRIDVQKKNRQSRACNLFNKKRNKKGIVRQFPRYINLVDWHEAVNKDKRPIFPTQSLWNLQEKKQDFKMNLFHNHGMQLHRLAQEQQRRQQKKKPKTIQQLIKAYAPQPYYNKCWQDKGRVITFLMKSVYGMSDYSFLKNQIFELYDVPTQIIQKRIQFQEKVQTNLQQNDDRRRKDALEQEKQFQKQDQKRNYFNLNIGYKFLSQIDQTQYYQNKNYCNQFLPIGNNNQIQKVKIQEKSQESHDIKQEIIEKKKNNLLQKIDEKIKSSESINNKFTIRQINKYDNNSSQFDLQFCINSTNSKSQKVIQQKQIKNPFKKQNQWDQNGMKTQLQKICYVYLRNLQQKFERMFIQDPQVKPIKFIYFPSYGGINRKKIKQVHDYMRIFIVCEDGFILAQRLNAFQQIKQIKIIIFLFKHKNTIQKQIKEEMKIIFSQCRIIFSNILQYKIEIPQIVIPLQIGILHQFSKDKDQALTLKQQEIVEIGKQIKEDLRQFLKDGDDQLLEGQQQEFEKMQQLENKQKSSSVKEQKQKEQSFM